MSLATLFSEVESNRVDYELIRTLLVSNVVHNRPCDINVIIPVMGRREFLAHTVKSLFNAIDNVNTDIIISVVEISAVSEHKDTCDVLGVNHFWLDIRYLMVGGGVFNQGFGDNMMFNKSLAMNIGYIRSSKSRYVLFHDVDCLVKSDFFIKLLSNIEVKSAKAIQTFHLRRVLCLNKGLTDMIMNLTLDIENINSNTDGVNTPLPGAPGGSILIESEVFERVGGYDPELFCGYSTEDAFFWAKVSMICEIHTANNPPIDIFHMYHTPLYDSNPLFDRMHNIWTRFNNLNGNQKLEFIDKKPKLNKW